jgi:sugar-specific transcriptional regulator TrmB
MSDAEAVTALERLGLTSYEARVFVALQRLGVGSASDIAEACEVPRSQVYGTAEKLEGRGLVDVQQSNPIQFCPVDLEEARRRLRDRYERREEAAFEQLESVRTEHNPDEQQEHVWTVTGRESVTSRATRLVGEATDSVRYLVGGEPTDGAVGDELVAAAERGVSVTVVSADDDVLAAFGNRPVRTVQFPSERVADDPETGRVLVVDGETLLLSIDGASSATGGDDETAIWSAGTGFAAVIIRLLDIYLETRCER